MPKKTKARTVNSAKDDGKYWIHPDPAHKGHLIQYVHDHYGEYGFTNKGTIKSMVLREMIHTGNEIKPYNHMAQFALNVRNIRKK